jgi:hypothetical protein
MSKGNAPSQRQLRAGELIRHALADIFLRGESGDPDAAMASKFGLTTEQYQTLELES